MDKQVALPQKIFWSPVSCTSIYIELSEKILTNKKKDSTIKKISVRVIRLIILIATATILMNLAVFYNIVGLVLKGSVVVITNISKKDFFGYKSKRYTQDFNKHLAYAIKDLAYQFFKPSLCVVYTLDPELFQIIDNLSNKVIEHIGF
jgi:hypothetical protein